MGSQECRPPVTLGILSIPKTNVYAHGRQRARVQANVVGRQVGGVSKSEHTNRPARLVMVIVILLSTGKRFGVRLAVTCSRRPRLRAGGQIGEI